MNEICGDNRFEVIAKAKEHLLDATNIDTSPKELEVLDDFLFRCWQMGWLGRYDHDCGDCLHYGDKQVCGRCRYYSLFASKIGR